MRFAVIQEIKAGGRTHRRVRLVVSDVPEGSKADAVMGALEKAGRAGTSAPPGKVGEFQAGGIPWGSHVVRSAAALATGTEGLDAAPVETWAELTGTAGVRRVTLRLTPETYDRVSMAAARSNLAIQKWFEMTIENALSVEEKKG